MSNPSLKEQLQAVASQIVDVAVKPTQQKQTNHQHQQQHTQQRVHQRPQQRRELPAKKPKPQWLEYAQYGVELLRVYFPAAFKEFNAVQPLKKGIKEELIKRLSSIENIVTDDKACMVKSLAYYVNTAFYHKAIVDGAIRIDLDGNTAGTVSAEEARYSFERHQAKQQAKQHSLKKSQVPQKENELVT